MVVPKRALTSDEETEEPATKKINNKENATKILKNNEKTNRKRRSKSKKKDQEIEGRAAEENDCANLDGDVNAGGLEKVETNKAKKFKKSSVSKDGECKIVNGGNKSVVSKDKIKERPSKKLNNGSGSVDEAEKGAQKLKTDGKRKKKSKNKKNDGQMEKEEGDVDGLKLNKSEGADSDDESKEEEKQKSGETEEVDEKLIKVTEINIKEFRNCLKNPQHKVKALEEFISVCNNSEVKVDYAKLYLEKGGSCLELVEMLGTNCPEILVIKTLTIIILKIIAKMQNHSASAFEACKYVLNTHIIMVNRMIGKSSGGKEKTAILKLLAAMVLLSDSLAKEILVHVNFNLENVNALSWQAVGGANLAVRDALTQFLVSFMINGSYPIISLFLNKSQLVTCVIKGFKFDPADNVCMYFNIIKKHVLENIRVSKTVKMRVFNTTVVKDIINLYNWSGPGKKQKANDIDIEKSKVSAEVHSFLLILCTSKSGIIFRDYTFGRGRKNVLMDEVLASLKQPWEHSYASDLVSNICGACPDLVSTIWNNLKPSLEPRNTPQWLNGVRFTLEILDKVQPNCIEYCAKDLDLQQYLHMVKTLAAPTEIIKVLKNCSQPFERHKVFTIFEKMLTSVSAYKDSAKRLFNEKFNSRLDSLLNDHLESQFPLGKEIFDNWDAPSEHHTIEEHLKTVLSILELYNRLSFNLLDSFMENLDFKEVIEDIKSVESESKDLQVRAIQLFTNLEPELLAPNSEIFGMILPEILMNYHETGVEIARNSLRSVFRNTGLFENCESEIDFWINSIDNVAKIDERIIEFFISVLKKTNENVTAYYEKMNELQTELGEAVATDFDEILEIISGEGESELTECTIKQNNFSPMILAAFETIRELESSKKHLKTYLNCVILNLFHYQTKRDLFKLLIEKNEDVVDSRLKKYVFSWDEGEINPLKDLKGKLMGFEIVSNAILNSNRDIDCSDLKHETDLLQMVIFYLTNLTNITEDIYKTCLFFAKRFSINNHSKLFKQSLLLKKFNPLSLKENYSTRFVIEMIAFLSEEKVDFESHVAAYRFKLFKQVLTALKKRKLKNVDKLAGIINLIKYDYSQCKEILGEITKLRDLFFEDHKTTVIYQICNYTLMTFTEICSNDYTGFNENKIDINSQSKLKINNHKESQFTKHFEEQPNKANNIDFSKISLNRIKEPLPVETIERLCDCLSELNKTNIDTSVLAKNLHEYFKKFPHSYHDVSRSLFESILTREENCKENSALAVSILENRIDFVEILENHIEAACSKKGLILPILDLNIIEGNKAELRRKIYDLLEASLNKVLMKPQKAGQNFENFHSGLCLLIKEFMQEKTASSYIEKVLKFEVGEVFHVNLLKAIFEKFSTTEKRAQNSILTMMNILICLFKRALKNFDEGTSEKITKIALTFDELLKKIGNCNLDQFSTNETFKLFCKFCLKFGIGANNSIVDLLVTLLDLVKLEDGAELMEMIISHSEFLNTILGEVPMKKVAVLKLFLLVCKKYGKVMCKAHIPFLLGGYSATLSESDQIILQILKEYESVPTQTNFYDFKPILWGTAASNHYSVRSDVQRSLFRQPRISDVLDILQEDLVLSTIENHPLDFTLGPSKITTPHENVYDLRFLLPLFSQILAPENNVPVYLFTKSGGLSVTILALSHSDKDIRSAACHVLARFHQHLEGRHVGKDNKLWIRFIEALCKGTAVLNNFQLNNFASIFFARMALTIIKPYEIMYKPLCHYLSAKETPNLNAIPELYTFLHSSDVNFKEHTVFILRILKDGLRTNADLKIFNTAMAYKLIMEIFTSAYSDFEIKSLILEVIKKASQLNIGSMFICNIYGLLSWLQEIIKTNDDARLLKIILETLANIITNNTEDLSVVELILKNIIYDKLNKIVNKDVVLTILKCVLKLSEVSSSFLEFDLLRFLVDFIGCKDCEYMLKFKQVLDVSEDESNQVYYVKHLTRNYLRMKSA